MHAAVLRGTDNAGASAEQRLADSVSHRRLPGQLSHTDSLNRLATLLPLTASNIPLAASFCHVWPIVEMSAFLYDLPAGWYKKLMVLRPPKDGC